MTQPGSTKRVATVYLLLAGLQRGVSFLILPLITRAMTPAEYGAASILAASALLLVAVFAPVELMVFRAAARDEDGPELIRAIGIYCYAFLPTALVVAAALLATIAPGFLGISGRIWAIELLAIGFLPAATSFALPWARANQDLRRFSSLALTSVVITAASKLVFVVLLRLGVLGWALSDLFSAVSTAALAIALVRLPRVTVKRQHAMEVLSFCVPLIPHRASFWALSSLSRPALATVSTLTQVGLLSFGVNIASVAYLILTEVNQAVQPHYARERLPAPTSETREIVRWQIILALCVPALFGAGLALLGPIIFPAPYWPSFFLTGVLLCGQTFAGLYAIVMNYLVLTAGLPRLSPIASTSGAAIIVIGIFKFGGPFGALGVAYATAAGFAAMAAVAFALSRVFKVPINWDSWRTSIPDVAIGLTGAACSIAALAYPVASTQATALSAGAVSIFTILVGLRLYQRRRTVQREA